MIPAGYMYKKIARTAELDWFRSDTITDIYSVCNCISGDFADFINFWKHNEFYFFDTPAVMEEIAAREQIDLSGMTLFYYEVFEKEFNADTYSWNPLTTEGVVYSKTIVEELVQSPRLVLPKEKQLEGFDVVTFSCHTNPEHSPLSCNGMHEEIPVNKHCLLDSFDEAKDALERGAFTNCEPGPYRIFAVYTVS